MVLVAAVLLLAFLLLSALFSGSEVALFSLASSTRESISARGGAAGKRILKLLENPRSVRATILVLSTITNIMAAIVAAALAGALATAMGWDPALTLTIEVIILTMVLLTLVQLTPRMIVSRHAFAFSRAVSGPLWTIHRTLSPMSMLLARSSDVLRDRMRRSQKLSNEELKAMADAGEAHGTLEEEERELIHSIVEFGETTVREIMVSRVDMVAIPVTASVSEAVELIRSSGHSRLPLFIEHLDNIAGIVYAKDLLPHLGADRPNHLDWTRLARRPMFVPPGKKLDDLLKEFQARKTHIAIVVDEYGGTAGLVTLEDVLEEIVGDIRDEHDEFEPAMYEIIEPRVYLVDGRIDLDELDELLGVDIDSDQFDFETLGGLIFHLTGTIPDEGEEIAHGRLVMRVETRENNRIGKVLVRVRAKDDEFTDEAQDDRR